MVVEFYDIQTLLSGCSIQKGLVGVEIKVMLKLKLIIYFTLVGTYRIHGQSVIYRVIEAGLKAGYRAFGEYNRHSLSFTLHP
jgi:hypothetical protein